ncbi:MAG: sigma-54-dependent Fis family transcriptional regulator [Deltaproteobacteria bacterium]|nr:sigma-54-dependent Fis family transcriptional regulator [Deltaproteobacteria bacterium]
MLDVLLVDDEVTIIEPIGDALRTLGHRVTMAQDGAEAMRRIESHVYDLVISDVRLPNVDGLSIFRRLRAMSPSTDVILMTAYGTVTDAVAAIKDQARYYFSKPFDLHELVLAVKRIDERRRLRGEMGRAREELEAAERGPATTIVGTTPPMVMLKRRIQAIAATDAPVLITGESGTGKELVARMIHELSTRRSKAFVAFNCAAFPETLVEAELFGHERGAFTGAYQRREGRFRAADGGTMLLDEISEMSLPAQAKLLRVLQEGSFEPVGTNTSVHVDVRILSATNRDLRKLVAETGFRQDLYYRVKLFQLEVPPLRARRQDIPLLVEYFSRPWGGGIEFSPRAWAALQQYPFPGNVRELRHAVQHAMLLAGGNEVDLEHLPDEISRTGTTPSSPRPEGLPPLAVATKEFEREYLVRALRLSAGNRTRAAQMLGISRKGLWAKLRDLDIADFEPEE